mmetsp:Transcript_42280/g.95627  ORF Transcript_42280/g.95627 Transcript_42280/m.95627 type:complete len:210 (-) Transcript_42280:1924-2553(-)
MHPPPRRKGRAARHLQHRAQDIGYGRARGVGEGGRRKAHPTPPRRRQWGQTRGQVGVPRVPDGLDAALRPRGRRGAPERGLGLAGAARAREEERAEACHRLHGRELRGAQRGPSRRARHVPFDRRRHPGQSGRTGAHHGDRAGLPLRGAPHRQTPRCHRAPLRAVPRRPCGRSPANRGHQRAKGDLPTGLRVLCAPVPSGDRAPLERDH